MRLVRLLHWACGRKRACEDDDVKLTDAQGEQKPELDEKTPVEHTSIQLADAGNLSPKARGKQRVGAPLVREASKQSFIGDASTLMVKVRRAAPDQAFGMTVSQSNRVTEVVRGSPAESCGVRLFDKVLKIDGAPLADEDRLAPVLQGDTPPPAPLQPALADRPTDQYKALAMQRAPPFAHRCVPAS